MKYLISTLLILLIGFAVFVYKTTPSKQSTPNDTIFVGADIGGPFSLTNQNGEAVTDQDYAGQYKLIYFGFTFCPAICPTELQKITEAYRSLPENIREKITPIFISVDPERDTVAVMKDYVALFDPDLIGLTGSVEQVKAVMNEYRIYAAKVKDDTMSDYTVDHSSYIYLMSPEDTLMNVYKIDTSVTQMTENLKTLVK